MRYNLLTGKRGGAPKTVEAVELWRIFLCLLNARASFEAWLNPKEIKVLSWVLARSDDNCYFSKPHSAVIMDEVENLSAPELTRIKKKLIASGLVEEVFEGRKVKALPNMMLRRLRSDIVVNGEVDFSFHMKIDSHGSYHSTGR